MAISDYNTNPDLNTQISGINIAEGCPPSGINNAIRQLMADVKGKSTEQDAAIAACVTTSDIGAADITATGSTASRSLANRFADVVNVKDFGAVGNGTTDDTAAFLAAASLNKPLFVPDGTFLLSFSEKAQLDVLAHIFNGAILHGKIDITILRGHYLQQNTWVFSAADGAHINISGEEPLNIEIKGATFSKVGENWNVSLSYDSQNTIDSQYVGCYIFVYDDLVGTGHFQVLRGIWKILSVSSTTITILHTGFFSNTPDFTITTGTAYIIPTVVQWKDCDAIVVKTGCGGRIDNLAIIGNASEYWDANNITGTEKGTHGIIVGNATITQNGANPEGFSCTSLSLGTKVGVSDFDQQGIVAAAGSSVFARWVASCSNKRRGFYAESCGVIYCKNSCASGNFLDGYIADACGCIVCNLSASCGNRQNGMNAINNGGILANRSVALYNQQSGYMANGGSFISCTNSIAAYNNYNGLYALVGSSIFADNTHAIYNTKNGIEATNGSTIRANSVTSSSNSVYGIRASAFSTITNTVPFIGDNNTGGLISNEMGHIIDNGVMNAGNFAVKALRIYNSQQTHDCLLSVSSIGDIYIASDNNQIIQIKDNTYFNPAQDNTKKLGSGSKRWAEIFAANSAINTSDIREKQQITTYTDDVLDAWSEVEFRQFIFNDAFEKKGDAARLHSGVIAQQVMEAFAAHGLDATRYALLCYDAWEDEYEDEEVIDVEATYDDDGNELTPQQSHIEHKLVTPAGNRYGIRYSEALCLEAAYQRRRAERLEARVARLEEKVNG